MTTKSDKLERKLYLQKRALSAVKDFNNTYKDFVNLLSDGVAITPEEIRNLLWQIEKLKLRSKWADETHEKYLDYCYANNYKTVEIEYESPHLFHDEN